MVGVPGKSKGCNTCRRRKGGCDLQRPSCGQCHKSAIPCDGYARAKVWVNMNQDTGTERRYSPPPKAASLEILAHIPWTYVAKTLKDLLTDIFAEIRLLLADLDELRAADDAYIKREALHRKVWQREKQWREWRRKCEPQAEPVIESPEAVSPSQVFDSFLPAHIIGGHWTIGIFIYGVYLLANGTPPGEILPDETDPRRFCQKIIDIIPTFLHPYSGEYGVHGGIFPSLIALMYLEEADGDLDPSEACAIYALFDRCNRGRNILHFVENMRQRLRAGVVRLFEPIYS
ncbi:hypothetical protein BJX66DRAFT_341083 [Aspergillus keveii]|uniref:Zn(2)-C6 fungal-type domain-containing protein n=1 Tax=Aspergillus keveii TaxID=714993 RepID=A0ABR4FWA1_9EURO